MSIERMLLSQRSFAEQTLVSRTAKDIPRIGLTFRGSQSCDTILEESSRSILLICIR